MSFNVNTDVNYAAYLAVVAPLDGYTRSQFDAFLIKNFALQATNGATLTSGAGFSAILATVLSAAKQGNYTF
jgi:hypothetical protein